ncbi:MAG: cyclic nucleotide-binding domain-containing protein [Candidatus Eremiobacteraeota bacterium]|nr:cyclic nucleotide-binding domain-containing protein [Candidatus Eremiobacteraeota bacterium]
MSEVDLVGLLCRTELFKGLTTEQMKAVAKVVEFREFPAGRKIVKQAEVGEEFYIIASGEAQVLVEDSALNTHQVVLTLQSGQSFGETALLAREERSATVQATKPTICAVLSRPDFQSVLAGIPEIALAVCQYLAVRLAAQCKLTGFRFVSGEELLYDPRAYQIFPESLLRRCEAIPIRISGRTLTVALTRPNDPHVLALLRKEIVGMGLEPVGCTREDYEAFYQRHQTHGGGSSSPTYETGKLSLQYPDGSRLSASLRSVLETVLTKGSDYLFCDFGPEGLRITTEAGEPFQTHSDLDGRELRGELDRFLTGGENACGQGEAEILANGHRVLLSLSVLRAPTRSRYSIQLSDGNRRVPSLDNLILSQPLLRLMKDTVQEPSGVVVLEGESSSGLSTTLLSLATYHAQSAAPGKTLLFEERSQTVLDGVESWPLQASISNLISTAQLQRARLIGIDKVTEVGLPELLQRPLTGSVLLAVYQGQENVFDCLAQTDPGSLPGRRALRLVLRQKLAFRICEGCRRPFSPSLGEVGLLKESGLDNNQSQYFRGEGCDHCGGSGVSGHIPLFEAVQVTRELLESLRESPALRAKAVRTNTTHRFQDYARALISQGTIDPTEGLRLFPAASSSFSFPN